MLRILKHEKDPSLNCWHPIIFFGHHELLWSSYVCYAKTGVSIPGLSMHQTPSKAIEDAQSGLFVTAGKIPNRVLAQRLLKYLSTGGKSESPESRNKWIHL